jgi:hypothetical protein
MEVRLQRRGTAAAAWSGHVAAARSGCAAVAGTGRASAAAGVLGVGGGDRTGGVQSRCEDVGGGVLVVW